MVSYEAKDLEVAGSEDETQRQPNSNPAKSGASRDTPQHSAVVVLSDLSDEEKKKGLHIAEEAFLEAPVRADTLERID